MLTAIIYACGVFGHVDFRKTIASPVISTKEDQFGITVPVMSGAHGSEGFHSHCCSAVNLLTTFLK